MSESVIIADNLGKKYIIGHQGVKGYKTFREQMLQHVHNFYSRTKKLVSGQEVLEGDEMEEFWALKDLNFEIKRGERIGIIGRNGAGKSTLLKILSRITEPTTGTIRIKGRIASLLEVGTGFHQELTGRENIFLNGAILGMSRSEIKKKFDEIVNFSGVEKFLDTPVKRYSSGMYVRLAFAIAAHLEPEILIVDEVLAVGDLEFQEKCIRRMNDISNKEGRTILFVSHNMSAIRTLCNKGILLEQGQIKSIDKIEPIIDRYLDNLHKSDINIGKSRNRKGNGNIIFSDFEILNKEEVCRSVIFSGEDISFLFTLTSKAECKKVSIGFSIHDETDDMLTVLYSEYQNVKYDLGKGIHTVRFDFKNNNLSAGKYYLRGLILENNLIADWPIDPIASIIVEAGNFYGTNHLGHQHSRIKFLIKGVWTLKK